MTEEVKGFWKGVLVSFLFLILILGVIYFYIDKKYIEPLKKAGLIK